MAEKQVSARETKLKRIEGAIARMKNNTKDHDLPFRIQELGFQDFEQVKKLNDSQLQALLDKLRDMYQNAYLEIKDRKAGYIHKRPRFRKYGVKDIYFDFIHKSKSYKEKYGG